MLSRHNLRLGLLFRTPAAAVFLGACFNETSSCITLIQQ